MCFSMSYRHLAKPKKKMRIILSEEEAVDMAFFTEIPYDKPMPIREIQRLVHEVQKRPWFDSEPMTIPRVRSFINERILKNPRKSIEIDRDIYLFHAR